MTKIQAQFITDKKGKKISAVIPIKTFEALLEELEDLEDQRLYDEAKKNDTGERISFDDYLKKRKKKNA
jgi:hypothetical protein